MSGGLREAPRPRPPGGRRRAGHGRARNGHRLAIDPHAFGRGALGRSEPRAQASETLALDHPLHPETREQLYLDALESSVEGIPDPARCSRSRATREPRCSIPWTSRPAAHGEPAFPPESLRAASRRVRVLPEEIFRGTSGSGPGDADTIVAATEDSRGPSTAALSPSRPIRKTPHRRPAETAASAPVWASARADKTKRRRPRGRRV
ncbi:MAG: hypothetical protein DIJKHBIC_00359 [Thermoanaerobaculia bacterium]|nr:hypothetical protein [Thermoanaerobaculia bacterium]